MDGITDPFLKKNPEARLPIRTLQIFKEFQCFKPFRCFTAGIDTLVKHFQPAEAVEGFNIFNPSSLGEGVGEGVYPFPLKDILTIKQGSFIGHQPQQCTSSIREIPQKIHRFALFDSLIPPI